ncbi:DNA-binding protein [uncultured Halopseudomonas sp.]|jgi:DNA repair exonuclease SbcCD ATPase subunit|uniref:DNA-binding protein n=1 Tax=uncultured Halopseudomonas sp. TaxID=2901193 RepID=UPI0030EB6D94|tara:strand:+ start:1438 stop:2310 length:873 start_codon:yes stop_codon:yes gene_type:complete
MAIGVPETDVFAAADAVLARGERPTVERVRLELGRGSPARIGGLLDQWWARLAERLTGHTRLPELPAEISQAFLTVWEQAIQLARDDAERTLAAQWKVLNSEREQLAAAEARALQDAIQSRQQVAEALAGLQAAETRLADLELLLVQRLNQIDDLRQQRDELVYLRDEAQLRTQVLEQQLQDQAVKAEKDRIGYENYIRGVEDRAHCEIDRAREEAKNTAVQLKAASRQLADLQTRLEAAHTVQNGAQQKAAAEQARADTLAQQLGQFLAVPPMKTKGRRRASATAKRRP